MGYEATTGIYLALDPHERKLIRTRDIRFSEDSFAACAELTVELIDNPGMRASQQWQSTASMVNQPQRAPSTVAGSPDHQNDDEDDDPDYLPVSNTPVALTQPTVQVSIPPPTVPQPRGNAQSHPIELLDDSESDTDSERVVSSPPLALSSRHLPPSHPGPALAQPSPAPVAPPEANVRRSGRITRPVDRGLMVNHETGMTQANREIAFGELIAAAAELDLIEPANYKQAMASSQSKQWQTAIRSELDSLAKNGVMDLVQPPPGCKPIKCRWVLKIKRDENNKPVKFKARVVAKGYLQRPGLDYTETYAPVARLKSIKLLMCIVAQLNLELKQLDYDTAFLNAPLTETVYMEQPEGSPTRGDGRVCHLRKALYGLKQSPREWNSELHKSLAEFGYIATKSDVCVYTKAVPNTTRRIILCLYVDDTIVAYDKRDEQLWNHDKATIAGRYSIKDLGDCHWLLGMEVRRDRPARTLTLSQRAYAERALAAFNYTETRSVANPVAHAVLEQVLPPGQEPVLLDNAGKQHYQSLVGTLLYAALLTRPDLAYATVQLSQHCAAPAQHHLAAAQHTMRYWSSTSTLGLQFKLPAGASQGPQPLKLEVFTDASYISERTTYRSHTGIIVLMNGCAVDWTSRRQARTTLSSTEAELIAMCEGAKDAVWLRNWCAEVLGYRPTIPLAVRCDNQAAIAIAKNCTDHSRTRHFGVRHAYISELITEDKTVTIQWIEGKQQAADFLTKRLVTDSLQQWVNRFCTKTSSLD